MQYTWNDIEQHIAVCTQCSLSKTSRGFLLWDVQEK